MNFKCYNTDDYRIEEHFSIDPSGRITADWGKEKPHWKLLLGTGVIDEDREVFTHDLYINEYNSLHEVVFYDGGFWLEVDYLSVDENLLMLDAIRSDGLKYIGNAWINPDVYQKYSDMGKN